MKRSICTGLKGFYFALVFISGVWLFAQSPVVDSRFSEAINLHDRAVENPDMTTILKAKNLLEPHIKNEPVAEAYYGSLITLEAAVAIENNKAMQALALLEKGMAHIDTAIERDGNSPLIRLLRTINSYSVSETSPLKRYNEMEEDILWLDARKANYEPAMQGSIALYKGLYLIKKRRLEEALDSFDECIEISPNSEEAKEAERNLAKYEG